MEVTMCDTPDIEYSTRFPIEQWGEEWKDAIPREIEQPDRCAILLVDRGRFRDALKSLGVPENVMSNIPFIEIHQFGGAHALLFDRENAPRPVELPKKNVTVLTNITTISITSLPGGCEVIDCCGGLICAHDK